MTVPKPTRGRAAKSEEVAEVEVVNEEPLQVEVLEKNGKAPEPIKTKDGSMSLPPQTTEEGDRVTAGQRQTSFLWEVVQAGIAFAVTGVTLYVLAILALNPVEPTSNQLQVISHMMVMTTLILTFYFQRTNHTRIGGVGPKANEQIYRGR